MDYWTSGRLYQSAIGVTGQIVFHPYPNELGLKEEDSKMYSMEHRSLWGRNMDNDSSR